MKPTDEAKRLQEEIITQLSHLILRYDADGEERASIEGTADEFINKVLDAVVGATPEGINGGAYEEDDYAGGWNHALNAYEDEIAKLRP